MINRYSISLLGLRFLGLLLFLHSVIGLPMAFYKTGRSYNYVLSYIIAFAISLYFLRGGKFIAGRISPLLPQEPISSYFSFALTLTRLIGIELVLKSVPLVVSLSLGIAYHIKSLFNGGDYGTWIQEIANVLEILIYLMAAGYMFKRGKFVAKLLLLLMPGSVTVNIKKEEFKLKAVFCIGLCVIGLQYVLNSVFYCVYLLIHLSSKMETITNCRNIINYSSLTYTYANVPLYILTLLCLLVISIAWRRAINTDAPDEPIDLSKLTLQGIKVCVAILILDGMLKLGKFVVMSVFATTLNKGFEDYVYVSSAVLTTIWASLYYAVCMFILAILVVNKWAVVANFLTYKISEESA